MKHGQAMAPPLQMALTVVIVAAIMIFAADVLIPLALATLLSFVLAIPARALERLRAPRSLAAVVVVVAAFGVMIGLGQILAREVSGLADRMPQYEAAIAAKIEVLDASPVGSSASLEPARRLLKTLQQGFEASRPGSSTGAPGGAGIAGAALNGVPGVFGVPLQWLAALVSPLLGPLTALSLAFVFVVFILIQREDLQNRLIRLAGASDLPRMTRVLDEAGRRLSRLLLTQLVINTTYGAVIAFGLSRIGVPSAFVWGVLSGALRFVPFVGPILGLIFPLTLSIAIGSGWSTALWTVALYAGLEGVTGQVVEPLFEGRTTGLTPVAIVLAATFWGWIWGPIGLVMATPLTVVLVVLGRHFEALKAFDILLGASPALSDAETLYQRMLSGNIADASLPARSALSARALADQCDAVVMPALLLAQTDHERGVLGPEALATVEATVARLFDVIVRKGWGRDRTPTTGTPPAARAPAGRLVSIAGPGALDDAAAVVVAALAKANGLAAVTAPRSARLDLSGASVVVLSCLDKHAGAALADEARRIRAKSPDAQFALLLWGGAADARIGSSGSAPDAGVALDSFRGLAAMFADVAANRGEAAPPSSGRGASGAGEHHVGN